MALQILQEEASLEALGQQVQAMQESVEADVQLTGNAYTVWQNAVSAQTRAQQAVNRAATDMYENSQGLGPYSPLGDTINGLGLLVPGMGAAPSDGEAAAVALTQARLVVATAQAKYKTALDAQLALSTQRDTMQTSFTTRTVALNKLKVTNQVAIAAALAVQDTADTKTGESLGLGTNANGQAANPKALEAVQFALKQLGKPYVFGAEGPNSYDCSGLTWASYRSVGVTIPRIADYQEHALTRVSVSELLPGDLLFFSGTNGTSWTSVSHVGMYLGGNKMIEAPTSGENVKIAGIWWSHFFSAGRVLPAIPAPPQTPPATPPPTTPPKPPVSPSPTPTPSPTPPKPPVSPSPPPTSPTAPPTSPSSPPSSPPSTPPSTPSDPPSTAPTPPDASPTEPSQAPSSRAPSITPSGNPTPSAT